MKKRNIGYVIIHTEPFINILKEEITEMAKRYNLSQGVQEGFEFVLTDPDTKKDLVYNLRYPSASDFEPSKSIDVEIEDLQQKMGAEEATVSQKKDFQARIDDLEKEKAKLFYKLVTPVDHDVDIEDVLNRVNVVVVRNFNNMISAELGA